MSSQTLGHRGLLEDVVKSLNGSDAMTVTGDKCQRMDESDSYFLCPKLSVPGNVTKVIRGPANCGKTVPLLVAVEQQDVSPDYLNQLREGHIAGYSLLFLLHLTDPSYPSEGNKVVAQLSLSSAWEVAKPNTSNLLVGSLEGSLQWPCSGERITIKGTITAWLVSTLQSPPFDAEPDEAAHNLTTFRARLQLMKAVTPTSTEPIMLGGDMLQSAIVPDVAGAPTAVTLGIDRYDGMQHTIPGPVTTAFISPSGMLHVRAVLSNGPGDMTELRLLGMQQGSPRLAIDVSLPELNTTLWLQAGPGITSWDQPYRYMDPTGDQELQLLQSGQSGCLGGVFGHAEFLGGPLGANVEGVLCLSIYGTAADGSTVYGYNSLASKPEEDLAQLTMAFDILITLEINHLANSSAGNDVYESCAQPAAAVGAVPLQGNVSGQVLTGMFYSTSTELVAVTVAREQASQCQATMGPVPAARSRYYHTASFTGHLPQNISSPLLPDVFHLAAAFHVPGYGVLKHSFELFQKAKGNTVGVKLEHIPGSVQFQGELAVSTTTPCTPEVVFDTGFGSYTFVIADNETSGGADVQGTLQWTAFDNSSFPYTQFLGCPDCGMVLPGTTLPDVVAFDMATSQPSAVNATGLINVEAYVCCNSTSPCVRLALTAPVTAHVQHVTIVRGDGLISIAVAIPSSTIGLATIASDSGIPPELSDDCPAKEAAKFLAVSPMALWEGVQAGSISGIELMTSFLNGSQPGHFNLSFTVPVHDVEITAQVSIFSTVLEVGLGTGNQAGESAVKTMAIRVWHPRYAFTVCT